MDLLTQGADNQMQKSAVRQELLQLFESAGAKGSCCASKSSCKSAPSGCATARSAIAACSKTPAGIATYTLDGVIVSVNARWKPFWRRPRDVLAASPTDRLMTAASLAMLKGAKKMPETDNRDSWCLRLGVGASDGPCVPVESHCRFLRGKDWRAGLVMATYRDLTTERQLERQRAEFTAMLAHDIPIPRA